MSAGRFAVLAGLGVAAWGGAFVVGSWSVFAVAQSTGSPWLAVVVALAWAAILVGAPVWVLTRGQQ